MTCARLTKWLAWCACALPAACSAPPHVAPPEAMPEGPSGYTEQAARQGSRFAVATANPLASEAGFRILDAGGSAVDAAVAVQMVLALVEPQSSGVGGGAFLLHWDGRKVQAWDGRETAPAAADERLFLRPDGNPVSSDVAVIGGRAVGVPGAVRMLEQVHREHGRLPWPRLIEPAVQLAEQGFALSPRMHALLKTESALKQDPRAAAYFYRPDGTPHAVGHRLHNPALAQVLRMIAARGSAALHEGPVADDIVRRVRGHPSNPGRLALSDLRDYRVVEREPMCNQWKTTFRVCGMPPPSSGHLTMMQILGLLEHVPATAAARTDGLPGADWLHHYTEVSRLAYADRAAYIADPAFVTAPAGRWSSLLDDAYLRQRASIIGARSLGRASPGAPEGQPLSHAPQAEQVESGTSHVSIVDGQGRALAMTTTIEAVWGSRIFSDGGTGLPGGFLLNNQLSDFSMLPHDELGRPVANRVQPGKRPRSSMSPTLVLRRDDGSLVMTLGSPGGAGIIHFTAKTLIATLDWGIGVQQAISLPNFGTFNGPTLLERGRFPAATVQALQERGHTVMEVDLTSGLQAIELRGKRWFGGADPRREGLVMGR